MTVTDFRSPGEIRSAQHQRLRAGVPQALRLRRLGLTYGDIAVVMGEYHRLYYAESYWRSLLVEAGAPLKRPGQRVGQGRVAA